MKVWEVEVELNMNASNTIKLEIVASTEHKARINAKFEARKKYLAFFTKIVNVKYLGIYRKS
jgi:hypothetical protein